MGDHMLSKPCRQIGLCYDLKSDYIAAGVPPELLLGFENLKTVNAITVALEKAGFSVLPLGNLHQVIIKLAANHGQLDCDLVFSIHSGIHGLASESQMASIFEAYRIPFAMSDAATLAWCADKAKTKMVLESFQIPTAPFLVIPSFKMRASRIFSHEDFTTALSQSKHAEALSQFPLFLKPVNQSSSVGISLSNRVHNEEELDSELERLSVAFPADDILIETFLAGREFTVGIIGTGPSARCIGMTEMKFPKDLKTWPDFYADVYKMQDTFVHMEPKTPDPDKDMEAKAAMATALRAWAVLGGRDCGRVDIRLNEHGSPYVLEINPIPGFRPGVSDLPLLAEAAGFNYNQLIQMIIDAAILRYKEENGLTTKPDS